MRRRASRHRASRHRARHRGALPHGILPHGILHHEAVAHKGNDRETIGGFTLIEIVVVLFFMVVAAAMALPRFTAFQRSGQARDAARNVAALVREARELAIERQRPIALQVGSSRTLVLAYDDTLLPPDTSFGNGTTGSLGSQNPNRPGGSTGPGQATMASDAPPRPPLFLPEPLMAAIQVDEQSSNAGAPASAGDLTFMPDGRAPDADILIQYAPNRAMLVTIRQQATRIQIANGDASGQSPLGAP